MSETYKPAVDHVWCHGTSCAVMYVVKAVGLTDTRGLASVPAIRLQQYIPATDTFIGDSTLYAASFLNDSWRHVGFRTLHGVVLVGDRRRALDHICSEFRVVSVSAKDVVVEPGIPTPMAPETVARWKKIEPEFVMPTIVSRDNVSSPSTRDVAFTPPWWEAKRDYPSFGDEHWDLDPNWFYTAVVGETLAGGPTVTCSGEHGVQLVDRDTFVVRFTAAGFRLVAENTTEKYLALVHEGGLLRAHLPGIGKKAYAAFATNSAVLREVADALVAELIGDTAAEQGRVLALLQRNGRFVVEEIGVAGVMLERANYADAVLAGYDHVVLDLNSPAPCGRLVVLSGAPGSGKTYLVRSLLGAVPRASFVVVPPHLVASLGNPDFLPAIQEARNDRDGPLVLVCEDGDQCLVTRMADNVSDIQGVLNLGDGILGALLDVRVLVTTNAAKLEMDRAVTRDGRLCRHVTLGKLDAPQASAVLRRLLPDFGVTREPYESMTLAQVYRRARDLGWTPVAKVEAK